MQGSLAVALSWANDSQGPESVGAGPGRGIDNGCVHQPGHPRKVCRLVFLGMTLAGCANAAGAEDLPAVTPYRPTVSVPAALSAPGWLEVEAGLQSSRADDPHRRDSLPYALKLAFTPDWGIRVTGDAVVHVQSADGGSLQGGGDVGFVLKRRFAVDEASAFGIELGVKIATARSGLGRGNKDVGLEGIYSSDFAPQWHVDLNAAVTQLGGPTSGTGAWQQAWAAAVSRNLSDRVGVSAELSGTQLAGASRTAQVLVASSYLVSRTASLDFGLSKGLTAASGRWSVFTGITFLAARLF